MIDGGEEEDRTPDLRIANAALSQLSYPPDAGNYPINEFYTGALARRRSNRVIASRLI